MVTITSVYRRKFEMTPLDTPPAPPTTPHALPQEGMLEFPANRTPLPTIEEIGGRRSVSSACIENVKDGAVARLATHRVVV